MHHVTIELHGKKGDTLSDLVAQLDGIKEQLLEGKTEGHDAKNGRYAFECVPEKSNEESDLQNGLHRPKPLTVVTVTYTKTGESRVFLMNPGCYARTFHTDPEDKIRTAHIDRFRKYDSYGDERESPLPLGPDGKYWHYSTHITFTSTQDLTFKGGLSPSCFGLRCPVPSNRHDDCNNDVFRAFSANSISETLKKIVEKSAPSNPDHFDTKAPVMFFHRDFSGNERYFHAISIGGGDDHRAIEIDLRECDHPRQYKGY